MTPADRTAIAQETAEIVLRTLLPTMQGQATLTNLLAAQVALVGDRTTLTYGALQNIADILRTFRPATDASEPKPRPSLAVVPQPEATQPG